MKVQVFQHVPFEGLGNMEAWFRDRNAQISTTRFFEAPFSTRPELPKLEHDLLVIMGGPMSVNDEQHFPWLAAEKRYIASAVRDDKRVLGVCLGAQLIASALGAPVFPNPHKEIGWLDVTATDDAFTGFQRNTEYRVFQWHGETFDLPSGATLIARSEACEHQAFRLGRTWALQFHLEMTPGTTRALVAHCKHELVEAPYVQTESALLNAPARYYRDSQHMMERLLERVAGD